jgi:hypothetical protein
MTDTELEIYDLTRRVAQLRYALGVASLWMPELADNQRDLDRARVFINAMLADSD